MRFIYDKALFEAQLWEMRHMGLENAIAQASDHELGAAYALIQYRQRDFDVDNVAQTIALLRASPSLLEFATALATQEDNHCESPEEEQSTVEGAEQSLAPDDRDTSEDMSSAAAQYQPATVPSHAYDNAAVQECVDECVMSGALHLDDKLKRSDSSDSLVCNDDLETMLHHMPWKILRRKDIEAMDLLRDPETIKVIPDEWRTTVLGVKLACIEQESCEGSGTDLSLLQSLAIRGGTVLKDGDVEYPEDIVPALSDDHSWYDREYWGALAEQGDMGRVWTEVFPDTYLDDEAMQED